MEASQAPCSGVDDSSVGERQSDSRSSDEDHEGSGRAEDSESEGSGSAEDSESESDSESSGEDDEGCGSAEESESEAPELAVDQHGRVVARVPSTCFRFRSFSEVFSEATAPSLREDCCAAARSVRDVHANSEYSEGQTFWIGADETPRCSLEQVALDIFRLHTGVQGCTFDPERSGAEWWCLAMDAESSQVAWHWDKDYSLEQSGINISPHLGTVTYLSNVGAPTVMMDKTCSTDYSADISGDATQAFLSRPAFGKHVVFDGRFLHAAPSELSLWPVDAPSASTTPTPTAAKLDQRVSFLVNIWLNWQVIR